MLAQISNLEPRTLEVLGGLFTIHLGSIVGGYLSLRDRLTRIETKQDEAEKRHDRELDGLGLRIGTERAKAQLAETNKLKV